jgi:hypothetical protein
VTARSGLHLGREVEYSWRDEHRSTNAGQSADWFGEAD